MTDQEQAEHVVDEGRVFRHSAETIARLCRLEEFEFLRRAVEDKQRRMREALAGRLLSGEDLTGLQRQADYDRGFVDGMFYPFRVADSAVQRVAEWDAQNDDEPEEVKDMWSRYE